MARWFSKIGRVNVSYSPSTTAALQRRRFFLHKQEKQKKHADRAGKEEERPPLRDKQGKLCEMNAGAR